MTPPSLPDWLDPLVQPCVSVPPPGPASLACLERYRQVQAPMGPRFPPGTPPSGVIVHERGTGCCLEDVDGNRYVDLAAGFGALLLGHRPAVVREALERQAGQLWQALGDFQPSALRVELLEELSCWFPGGKAQGLLGQSGADSLTAALKTLRLATGKRKVVAFRGAYHGLSYAPLALCGLRESYREPLLGASDAEVTFLNYPATDEELGALRSELRQALEPGDVGGLVVEPVLGRGGCIVPPAGFLELLREETARRDALLVFDEIWTGLGRTGQPLASSSSGIAPDLLCLGKGLGGGFPISVCLGSKSLMACWSREREVVDTSTFAGAPLACAAALATSTWLRAHTPWHHVETVGAEWIGRARSSGIAAASIRGRGYMLAVDLGKTAGAASVLARELLARGWLVSTGGGSREVLVLTPPLTIQPQQLFDLIPVLKELRPT